MTDWFVGGYTADMEGAASGIARMSSRPDGSLEYRGVAVETASPSYLLLHDDVLYAAAEGEGAVHAFARAGDALVPLASAASGGIWPCHLGLYDGTLVVANYGDGRLGVLATAPLALEEVVQLDGSGPHERQAASHAHSTTSVAGRVLSADLGGDAIGIHELRGGTLARVGVLALPGGTGPRDVLAHPSGRVFVLGELANIVVELAWSGDDLVIVRTAPIPGTVSTDQAAALGLSVDGRFLFAGVRGSDLIATFDLSDGLAPVGSAATGGHWPRHFVVDGSFLHVANERSSTVTTLAIAEDGTLSRVGEPEPVPTPTFLLRA